MPITKSKSSFKGGHYTSGVGKTSKTRDPKCSAAMSQWKSSGTLTHDVALVLGKCRSQARLMRTGEGIHSSQEKAFVHKLEARSERPSETAQRLRSKVSEIQEQGRKTHERLVSRAAKERTSATTGTLIPIKINVAGKGKDRVKTVTTHEGHDVPAHIKAAKIPPGWTDVHASSDPNSDLIATGRDAKGRIQKIYKDEYHMRNAANKFSRIRDLASEHESIMSQVHKDRKSNDFTIKDPAELTWLISEQGTRPGSRSDTGGKVKAYGATTLEHHHVVEVGGKVRLRFVGKEGVKHNHVIKNKELAQRLLERKKAAEAGENGGRLFSVHEGQLNDYIKKLGTGGYTAKDFRTHLGTKLAAEKIKEIGTRDPRTVKEHKARVKAVSEHVSSVLGNKPKQAHDSYIDPTVWSVWNHPHG